MCSECKVRLSNQAVHFLGNCGRYLVNMGEVRRSLRSTQNINDAFLDVSESDIRAIRNETAELIGTFVRILLFLAI